MAIIYRSGLGRELTFDEMDENFRTAEFGLFAGAANNSNLTVTALRDVEYLASNGMTVDLISLDNGSDASGTTYTYEIILQNDKGVARYAGRIWTGNDGYNDSFQHFTTTNINGLNSDAIMGVWVDWINKGSGLYAVQLSFENAADTVKISMNAFKGLGGVVSGGGS